MYPVRKNPTTLWEKLLIFLTVIFIVSTQSASASSTQETQKDTQLTAGFRVGDSTLEPFADFLIPLYDRNDGTLLLNPRFSLKDEGEFEGNFGIVWRKLIAPNAIIGTNAYVDSRRSRFGNRFNQAGIGFEVLSKWVDARVNWYDADSSPKVARETTSRETQVSTRTSSSTSVSSTTTYGVPTPREYAIVQDYTTTRTSTTTVTNTQTTTTTDRVLQEFEAGLDGYDAEIGLNLPISRNSPTIRLFAGVYDFQGEFGRRVEGHKARLEVKAGPYLTFDAEIFEDDALNGTDYFVGAKLRIPLKGRNTWESFKRNFRLAGTKSFAHRKYTDMVMRDVRVQTGQSEPIEDVSRQESSEEVVSSSSSISSSTVVSGTNTLRGNITFVDNGRVGGGIPDGTFENPFADVNAASFFGPPGNTIYIEGRGADEYDSEIFFNDGAVVI